MLAAVLGGVFWTARALYDMHPCVSYSTVRPLHGFGSSRPSCSRSCWYRSAGRLASLRPHARPLRRVTDATASPRPDRSPTGSVEGATTSSELADAFDAMARPARAHVANSRDSLPTPPTNCGPLASRRQLLRRRAAMYRARDCRPPPRQHASDRPHRSTLLLSRRRPTVPSRQNARPVLHSGQSTETLLPSQKKTRPHHRDLRDMTRPSAHTRCCCS